MISLNLSSEIMSLLKVDDIIELSFDSIVSIFVFKAETFSFYSFYTPIIYCSIFQSLPDILSLGLAWNNNEFLRETLAVPTSV